MPLSKVPNLQAQLLLRVNILLSSSEQAVHEFKLDPLQLKHE